MPITFLDNDQESSAKITFLDTGETVPIIGNKQSMTPVEFGKKYVTDPLLYTAEKVGGAIDRFAGAPTRAAINEFATSDPKNLNPIKDPLIQAPLAFAKQFGRDPSLAPTGKQIAQNLKIPSAPLSEKFPKVFNETGEGLPFKKGGPVDVSPAGVAGLGIDIGADVSNVVPIGTMLKGIAKGGKEATKASVKTGLKTADMITGVNTGERLIKASESGANTIAKGLKATFSGTQADDYAKFAEIAKKNGIDPSILPESVEFGKSSVISRAARGKAEGPAGEELLKKHEEAVRQINGALGEKVNNISGGQIYDEFDVGELIRDGFDKGVQKAFGELETTYNSVMKDNPGLFLEDKAFVKMDSKLTGLKKRLTGTATRGASKESRNAANQVLENIEFLENSNGSYKQTLEQLREIGDVAFSSGRNFETPPNKQAMVELYNIVRDALTETADYIDPMVGAQLRENNKIASELIGDKSLVAKIVRNRDVSNEDVFKKLVLNGDTKKIEALTKFLEPEEIAALKGSFLRSVLKQSIDDNVPFRQTFNTLRTKENVIGQLFDPAEIEDVVDLLKLGDRVGSPVLSSSGTGASNAFLQATKDVVPRAGESSISEFIKTPKRPVNLPIPFTNKRFSPASLRRPLLKSSQVYSVQKRNEEEK